MKKDGLVKGIIEFKLLSLWLIVYLAHKISHIIEHA